MTSWVKNTERMGKSLRSCKGGQKRREENVKVGTGCPLFGNWRRFFLGDDP
jgi:hypothetical protein